MAKLQSKPKSKEDGIKIESIVDTSKTTIINYENLIQLKDWPTVLGKGVQGVVEHMLLLQEFEERIPVAVKKIKLNQ